MKLALIDSEVEHVVPDVFDGAAARFTSAAPSALARLFRFRSA